MVAMLAVLMAAAWPFCLPALADRVHMQMRPPPLSDAECKVVPPDRSHLFIAAGVMHGDTLTNVQLADPDSRSTIVRVVVAAGHQPLTVFLYSYEEVVWDIEGATDRLHRVIVSSSTVERRVAVRGVPAERIEFPEFARCRPLLPPEAVDDEARDQAMKFLFGRLPDRIAFEGFPNSLVLPDAKFETTAEEKPRGIVIVQPRDDGTIQRNLLQVDAQGRPYLQPIGDPRNETEETLLRFHPGGFRQVDAKSLVSPVTVSEPETFPGEAGLVQLERSGAIRRPRPEEIEALVEARSWLYRMTVTPTYRAHVSVDYAITRAVMLPASLHGAHTVNFMVLNGVEAPRGNAGHGCLYFMNGSMAGAESCYDTHDQRVLWKLDLDQDLAACRLLQPSVQATIEAVSIYDPDNRPRPGAGPPGAVVVNVRKLGDVLLVLNDAGPVTWRIRHGGDTRIVGVLMTGYFMSSVEGLPADTPVASIHVEGRTVPDARCASFMEYVGVPNGGGPLVPVLDAQVMAATGRRLDGFRGGYALKEVDIR